MSVREAVDAALAAEVPGERDVATAEIARTYASLIDNAAAAAKYQKALTWLTDTVGSVFEDDESVRYLDTIRTALSAHSVASDLGPKLLASLEAMLLSPRARNLIRADVPSGQQAPPVSRLDQLAQRRSERGRAEAG